MPLPFSDLDLRRFAVHEIFVRETDRTPLAPVFSTSLAEIPRQGINVIKDRLTKAVASDARGMEMIATDQGADSPFRMLHELPEATDDDFVELSQRITMKLAGAQTSRSIPGGVVVIIEGIVGPDRKPFACIIKAEMHDGFRREMTETGPLIHYLSSLLLTPQQKFHKVGFFLRDQPVEDDEFPSEAYKIIVYDAQMSTGNPQTAAAYFYETFLGCSVAPNASRMTRDFYEASKTFINSARIGDEQKVELVTALHVYLRTQRPTIHTGEFAEDFLPLELHQGYVDSVRKANIPDSLIPLDTSLIKRKLKIRNLRFTNDVRVSAPAERFAELVEVLSEDGPWTNVRIKGTITRQD